MLFKQGMKSFEGNQTTLSSMEAIISLAEKFATSFGPNGLNKIVINHLEKAIITSDSASILADIEIHHPTAKMVALAAQMQEKEFGDGSNLVIIFAGQLCKMSKRLFSEGLQPNAIVSGFKKALSILSDFCDAIKPIDGEQYENNEQFIKSAISTKMSGFEDHFVELINNVCKAASSRHRPTTKKSQPSPLVVDDVQTFKVAGGSVQESFACFGLAFAGTLLGEQALTEPATVAVFNGSVEVNKTDTKGVVLLEGAQALLDYNAGEESLLAAEIAALKELGVNLIVSAGNFGDVALHYMAQNGISGFKVASKFDLRRLLTLVYARAIPLFGSKLSREDLGHCKCVRQTEIGSQKIVLFEQDPLDAKLATVVLRGSSRNVLDNAEKAVEDGINAMKNAANDQRLSVGGGAAEIALSKHILRYNLKSRNALLNYGVEAFAEALEVVPRLLAKSCGMDEHKTLTQMQKGDDPTVGVDLETRSLSDLSKKGVFDLMAPKRNALRLATEVVCTVLLIDNVFAINGGFFGD